MTVYNITDYLEHRHWQAHCGPSWPAACILGYTLSVQGINPALKYYTGLRFTIRQRRLRQCSGRAAQPYPTKQGGSGSRAGQQARPEGPLPPGQAPGAAAGNGRSCLNDGGSTLSPSSPRRNECIIRSRERNLY